MTDTAPLLDAILASPCLPDYAEAINARLQEERQRRQRFYAGMSDEYKMEFIDGEVVMHSPARDWHLVAKKHLLALVDMHVRLHKLGAVRDEKCLCVFPRNDYEPDIVFFGPEKAATLKPDTLKFSVPDFAVEILSESTESRDRGVKFTDYEAHGIGEYWIIDPESRTLEQYVKRDGAFRLQTKSSSGEVRSEVVPGFCIPIPAIFDDGANLEAAAQDALIAWFSSVQDLRFRQHELAILFSGKSCFRTRWNGCARAPSPITSITCFSPAPGDAENPTSPL